VNNTKRRNGDQQVSKESHRTSHCRNGYSRSFPFRKWENDDDQGNGTEGGRNESQHRRMFCKQSPLGGRVMNRGTDDGTRGEGGGDAGRFNRADIRSR